MAVFTPPALVQAANEGLVDKYDPDPMRLSMTETATDKAICLKPVGPLQPPTQDPTLLYMKIRKLKAENEGEGVGDSDGVGDRDGVGDLEGEGV